MKFKLIHKENSNLGEMFCATESDYEKLFDTLDPLKLPKGTFTLKLYASEKWANKSNAKLPYYVPLICGEGADGHCFEFHILNTLDQTEGCIGVGDIYTSSPPALLNSSTTFIKFIQLLYGDIVEHQVTKWEFINE